jgi:hypothetical protein
MFIGGRNGISGAESLIWCSLVLMVLNVLVDGLWYYFFCPHILQALTYSPDWMLLTNILKPLIFIFS